MLLLGQVLEEMVHTPQSHNITVEIEAQREVGIWGPQMQTGQVVDGSLHLSGIILTSVGAHGSSASWLVLEAEDGWYGSKGGD